MRQSPAALRMLISGVCAGLWLAAAVPVMPAAAQGSEEQRAALYKEGVALADAGQWAAAVAKFRAVVAIRSAPPALFTLGQAEEHLGRLATAERTYEKALADARAAGNNDVAEASVRAISALTARVPRLVVRLDPATAPVDPKSVEVMVADSRISIDSPVKLDPGDYVVSVRAPGKQLFQTKALLQAGKTFEVLVTLAPDTAPAASVTTSPSQSAEPAGRRAPIGPIVLGGTGLIAGIVGYLVWSGGKKDYDSANSHCTGGVCPTQSLVNQGNGGRTQMIAGTVLLGVGGAALVTATLWWIAGRTSAAPAASVGLQLSPTGAGVVGRF